MRDDDVLKADESPNLWRWYPIAMERKDKSTCIHWRFAGDCRFSMPFFEDSLALMPREFRQTGLDSFDQFTEFDCLKPTAFLFHTSRSGSTLVSQLLATLSQCIVISEAPVIDDALQLCRDHPHSDHDVELLKAVVRSLGQRSQDVEQHLFVKLDSWHITNLPLIQRAFPETPLVFIYRHPDEILASHRKQRGMQMIPGLVHPDALGIDDQQTNPADLDGYCIRVLTSLFRSAEQHVKSSKLSLVNYSQLPDLIWGQFIEFFSISLNAHELRAMQDRASRHSKHARDPFTKIENRRHHQGDVNPVTPLNELYHTLEQYRLSQQSW